MALVPNWKELSGEPTQSGGKNEEWKIPALVVQAWRRK
jgi:hypothetical protein